MIDQLNSDFGYIQWKSFFSTITKNLIVLIRNKKQIKKFNLFSFDDFEGNVAQSKYRFLK